MSSTGSNNPWTRLLSMQRLGKTSSAWDPPWDQFGLDYDRIVFSSSFRRLKDKTQVYPLSENDFTRTRLTHSLEASCIGRTLGRKVDEHLRHQGLLSDLPSIEMVVAAACLAHDIGNPPFGHAGEAAIQDWAKANVG